MNHAFSIEITPDWRGLLRCIRREGMPSRVHHIEVLMDPEVSEAICERFDLSNGLNRADRFFGLVIIQ